MLIVLDHGQAATFVDLAAALQQALLAHAEEADLPADAIRWVHRESTAASALAVPLSTPIPVVAAPRLTVHDEAWEVTHEGRALSLTVLQYRLLRQLVTTWGRTVPVPRLAEAMFGVPFADHQRVIAHVKRLRRRLIEQGVAGLPHRDGARDRVPHGRARRQPLTSGPGGRRPYAAPDAPVTPRRRHRRPGGRR